MRAIYKSEELVSKQSQENLLEKPSNEIENLETLINASNITDQEQPFSKNQKIVA